MAVHQVVVAASPGDAVTNAALALRGVLRRLGPSEVHARYIDPRLVDEVRRLEALPGKPGDVLVYHGSVGEPAVAAFLLRRREPIVLLYHNITPARYFAELDPEFAGLLAAGRAELQLLRDRVVLALAVSAYNAGELTKLGYDEVRVSPLVFDPAGPGAASPDPNMTARLAEMDGPMALFVGQLLPHKRPDLLLEAYHLLSTYLVPEARLTLVGGGRSELYRRALEDQIGHLNLWAWITGWVTDAELAALYRRADLFITMSEHEGFCVPLVEAMTLEVPVIARRFAAIPETLAGAGLVLPPTEEPALVAEAMAAVLTDVRLAKGLVAAGHARVAEFDPDAARATFLEHLATVV